LASGEAFEEAKRRLAVCSFSPTLKDRRNSELFHGGFLVFVD
jgi:hypothetical protein